MRKVAIVLGLILFLFTLSDPQWGIGQIGEKGPPPGQMITKIPMEELELDKEIELLMFIELLELSQDQLRNLQDLILELFAVESEITQIQYEFKDFLLGFQGSREELDREFASYRERLKKAHDALSTKEEEVVAKIIALFARQGSDVLTSFLLESYVRNSILPDLEMLAYLIDMKLERFRGPSSPDK